MNVRTEFYLNQLICIILLLNGLNEMYNLIRNFIKWVLQFKDFKHVVRVINECSYRIYLNQLICIIHLLNRLNEMYHYILY